MGRVGIASKFARARKLTDELAQEVEAFFEAEPFQLQPEEQASGDVVYRVRVRAQPPVDWSLVIGDVVHNARSALDHLAYALVEANGASPNENTYFPITEHATGYGDKLRKALRGASKQSKDAVRGLQPWRGGDDELWRLHRLDIIDKHRLLIPVGAAQRGTTMEVTFPGFRDGDEPLKSPPIELLSKDRQYPLRDGAEVFRIMKAARKAPGSGFQTDHAVTFEVAFGEGAVVQGEPLVPTLRTMVDHAAAVVEPLVRTL